MESRKTESKINIQLVMVVLKEVEEIFEYIYTFIITNSIPKIKYKKNCNYKHEHKYKCITYIRYIYIYIYLYSFIITINYIYYQNWHENLCIYICICI